MDLIVASGGSPRPPTRGIPPFPEAPACRYWASMRWIACTLGLGLTVHGCRSEDPAATAESAGTDTDDVRTCEVDGTVVARPLEESGCAFQETDYQPLVNGSADDMWPGCVTDDGAYHLVDLPPSSIGRVEAYEFVAELLWRNEAPTADDFTQARVRYAENQGLESRVLRREDLHYPPIPEADWDPGVEPDKQCSVPENVEKYPERCAGPAQIGPLVDGAFAAGQLGQGNPRVHAARIDAALGWFLYLSTYKEAVSCGVVQAKDCDSAWAYYTGGMTRGNGVGLAGEVRAVAPSVDSRIFDGVCATRCWRDLYPEDAYPTVDEADADGRSLFGLGTQQLDGALHRGYAVVLRDRLARQVDLTDSASTANWAFLRVAGPVLSREAQQRDPDIARVLSDLWDLECPTAADLQAGIDGLDALFPCP